MTIISYMCNARLLSINQIPARGLKHTRWDVVWKNGESGLSINQIPARGLKPPPRGN